MQKQRYYSWLACLLLLIFSSARAQSQSQKTITGKVTDDKNLALPGASVSIKDKAVGGTSTDLNGVFKIKVSEGDVIVFKMVGFKTHEVKVGNQNIINVLLDTDSKTLDDVIVIGYGTGKKSDLTGTVSSVSAEEITARPSATVAAALQGQAPGVVVRTQSAAPGGNSSITIRGINSIQSGSSPLYVVDGIPLENINAIAPEDIESLEILKDASSTAIYGSRGANGVILITSKKGKKGKVFLSYSGRTTTETIPSNSNLMNGEEFIKVYTEYEKAKNPNAQLWYNGSSYDRPAPGQVGEGTNWFDETTRTGHTQNHQINLGGGSDKSTYSLSLSYFDQKGLFYGGNYKRLVARASNTYEINKWLSSGLDVYVTRSLTNSSGENTSMEGTEGTVNAIYKMSPAQSVYAPNGTYQANTLPSVQTIENPVALQREMIDDSRLQRTFGNFYLNFKIAKDLSFKISAGGDSRETKDHNYNPSSTIYGGLAGGIARLSSNINSYLINENILTYKKQFGQHKLDVVGGVTYEQNQNETFSSGARNFYTDDYLYNNLAAANIFDKPSSFKSKWSLASGLTRVNYNLKDKYLITATGRYDGSSKFGAGNKWGFFPSVAAAWRVSSEPFMKNFSWLSSMKLRASYGAVGNSNIGMYQSLAVSLTANYPLGNTIYSGVYNDNLENKDLKWETTTTKNLGADIQILHAVNLTIDAYYKKTNDLLMDIRIIETSGFGTALRNVGSLENKGLEFSADAQVLNRALKWQVKGDIFLNRNKILTLNGDASQSWKIGKPIGVTRGYIIDGVIRNQADLDSYIGNDGKPMNGAKLGDYRFRDLNGDGAISGVDQDIIFNPNPDFLYSFTNNLSYKKFSLSVFVYGSYGNQINNVTSSYLTNLLTIRNNLSKNLVNNYWTPTNTENVKYAALNSNSYNQSAMRNIEDGSFLRIQNITLGYDLKLKAVKAFKTARIYATALNMLTVTKYSGFDPDVSSDTGNQTFGNDRASYPLPKSLTLGVNLTF